MRKQKNVSQLEDRSLEIIYSEENKEKRMKKSEGRLHELWDTIKQKQFLRYWSPRRKREGEGAESLFKEIMAENFLNPGRNMDK